MSVQEDIPDDVKLWSLVTLGFASCATFLFLPCGFDGICVRNHISNTNPCLFWPIPRVLVSQTERNRQRQNSSGVVKKRVRFGSSREKKKLIKQQYMTHSSLVFSLLCYSLAVQCGIAFYQLNSRNSLCLFSHTHILIFRCLQFVPSKQLLSQAAAK